MSIGNFKTIKEVFFTHLRRILQFISLIEHLFLYFALLGIILISFTNVMMRNTGLGGLVWADRVLAILVLYIAVIGSSIAASEKKHITIELAYNIFPEKAHQHFRWVSHLGAALAAGLLAYFSLRMTLFEYRSGMEVIRGVGVWVPMSIMPFGFILITFRYFAYFFMEIASSAVEESIE